MAHEQSNRPDADPDKFGLKFDGEKPRWELVPFKQLKDIVFVMGILAQDEKSGNRLKLQNFDKEYIINAVMDLMTGWKQGVKVVNVNDASFHSLSVASAAVFYLLRGKSYSKEELDRTNTIFRWDLFNFKDIEGVVNVYTMGAKKYADNNWQKVSADRYFGAMMRHFMTIKTVNRYDSELGCLHMHQVIWNMIALMWLDEQSIGTERVTGECSHYTLSGDPSGNYVECKVCGKNLTHNIKH